MRVIMIGDPFVGKTSLLNRAMGGKFKTEESTTLGANWHLFTHECAGGQVELQIWDTAGSEKYRALGPLYYRSAVGAIVVYDITSRTTFENVQRWISSFTATAGMNVVIIVIGNKSDDNDAREVTDREGLEWCEEHNYDWYETSAKTGQNVQTVFEMLAEKVSRIAVNNVPRVDADIRSRQKTSQQCC
jgi:small GTP-binding protein